MHFSFPNEHTRCSLRADTPIRSSRTAWALAANPCSQSRRSSGPKQWNVQETGALAVQNLEKDFASSPDAMNRMSGLKAKASAFGRVLCVPVRTFHMLALADME